MSIYYGNITLNPTSTSGAYLTAGPSSATWTTGTTYTLNPNTYSDSKVQLSHDGIKMDESADIIMGQKSLKKSLEAIEQRLAIMHPNHKLENEWEELKRLGDEYRKLEEEILEKMKTWDTLKKKF